MGYRLHGPFPVSYGNSYILLAIDYVSRWVEARATKANDAKIVVEFVKFGVPKAVISNQGSHFYNRTMPTLLSNLSFTNQEVQHGYDQAGQARKLQLQELEELHLEAYENAWVYKKKELNVNQKVLLFRFRLRLIASKLYSRWNEPFVVTNVFPYGVVEVRDIASHHTFKVNGDQLKSYHKGPNLNSTMGEVEIITLVELVIPEDPPEEVLDSPKLKCRMLTHSQVDAELPSAKTGSYPTWSWLSVDEHNKVGLTLFRTRKQETRVGCIVLQLIPTVIVKPVPIGLVQRSSTLPYGVNSIDPSSTTIVMVERWCFTFVG
ncbi:hypothetical protein CR513_12902, partial [Mucuna pruriens]